MTNKEEHISFTPSGCLTLDTMKRYRDHTLSAQEIAQVEKHLETCELCRDALEGLNLVTHPEKLDSIVAEINQNLRANLKTPKKEPVPAKISVHNGWFYSGIAAAIIILLAVVIWLIQFRFTGKLNQPLAQVIDVEEYQILPRKPLPPGQTRKPPEPARENDKIEKKQNRSREKNNTKGTTGESATAFPERNTASSRQEQDLSSLKLMKGNDSTIKTYLTESAGEKQEPDHDALDIASIQPLEFYIGEVVVYNDKGSDSEKYDAQPMSMHSANQRAVAKSSEALADQPRMALTAAKAPKENEEIASEDTDSVRPDISDKNAHFFSMVEKMPEFPGGRQALTNYFDEHLSYPSAARKQGIQGTVYLSFIIEPDGKVTDVKVLRGIGGGCDEEARKVLQSMPDWNPASQNHQPVPVLITIPVSFRLR